MATLKGAALGLAIAVCSTIPALADSSGIMEDRYALVLTNTGQWTMARLSPGARAMMRRAKPMKAGIVVFNQGGRLYWVSDPRGTLYQQRRDWLMSSN